MPKVEKISSEAEAAATLSEAYEIIEDLRASLYIPQGLREQARGILASIKNVEGVSVETRKQLWEIGEGIKDGWGHEIEKDDDYDPNRAYDF